VNWMSPVWSDTPPAAPGYYWSRRSWQWEPIMRNVNAAGQCYSHRYAQRVPAAKLGGQWGSKEGL